MSDNLNISSMPMEGPGDRHMMLRPLAVLSIVSLAFALSLSGNASAAERAIQPGDSYSVEVELSFIQPLTYSWSSDVALDFVIEDPSGAVVVSVDDSMSESDMYFSLVSGTYTLTWSNYNPAVAHLTFTSSVPWEEASEAASMLMWTVIIVGVVITVVIVVIVIVVVMGSRKTARQPTGPPPEMTSQALASGHCPTCGAAIDPNTSFCARCGTKFR